MYWPRRILILVLLWHSWSDSDCIISQRPSAPRPPTEATLREVLGGQFSNFLTWLENENVCLRRGETAENACYLLKDFETGEPGAILGMRAQRATNEWKANPFSDMQRCRVWYNRLWNSIAFILAGEEEDTSTILLARAASSGRERYKAHRFQIGNAETFSKGQIGGEGGTIGGDMRLDVAASRADVAGTVRDVMAWMKAVMPV